MRWPPLFPPIVAPMCRSAIDCPAAIGCFTANFAVIYCTVMQFAARRASLPTRWPPWTTADVGFTKLRRCTEEILRHGQPDENWGMLAHSTRIRLPSWWDGYLTAAVVGVGELAATARMMARGKRRRQTKPELAGYVGLLSVKVLEPAGVGRTLAHLRRRNIWRLVREQQQLYDAQVAAIPSPGGSTGIRRPAGTVAAGRAAGGAGYERPGAGAVLGRRCALRLIA